MFVHKIPEKVRRPGLEPDDIEKIVQMKRVKLANHVAVGYSNKPLAKKLGIKQGQNVAIVNPPQGYDVLLGKLADGVTVKHELSAQVDFIHFFAKDLMTLKRGFRASKEKLKQDGMIWVSWPKASSRTRTNLNERMVREIGLRNGLVDVKICAVDQTWSALKFVIPLRNRRSTLRKS